METEITMKELNQLREAKEVLNTFSANAKY